MAVLADLGSVAKEFMCYQWERKGMNTDVYQVTAIRDQRQMSFILKYGFLSDF
jgi:hypothetical protein